MLRLREALVAVPDGVLHGAAEEALRDETFFRQLLHDVCVQYAELDARRDSPVEVRVSDEKLKAATEWAMSEIQRRDGQHHLRIDLKGKLQSAGFEYNATGGTVEVTPESVLPVPPGASVELDVTLGRTHGHVTRNTRDGYWKRYAGDLDRHPTRNGDIELCPRRLAPFALRRHMNGAAGLPDLDPPFFVVILRHHAHLVAVPGRHAELTFDLGDLQPATRVHGESGIGLLCRCQCHEHRGCQMSNHGSLPFSPLSANAGCLPAFTTLYELAIRAACWRTRSFRARASAR